MPKLALTKLKITAKRLLGKCVYACVYTKASLIKLKSLAKTQTKSSRKHKNNVFNLIALCAERWRGLTAVLLGFFLLYYGIGAAISSKIDKNLSLPLSSSAAGYTPAATALVLKMQVDENPWTPALPLIFPVAVTDNLQNFQLGAKNTVKYFINKISKLTSDKNLAQADELLNYPPDIWLFSKTKKNEIAPGSAKQYRKALAKINAYAAAPHQLSASADALLFFIKAADDALEHHIAKLDKHAREHNSDIIDFKADDIFYKTQGSIYALYYILQALSRDYQQIIVQQNQYENITSALKLLEEALVLNPISVKNAPLQDLYAANHLLYLAYFLSAAQNRLKSVAAGIQSSPAEPTDEN